MNVPPYIPQPIEVPLNVADGPHKERVRFIRRVVSLHTLSVMTIGAISVWAPPITLPYSAAIVAIASLFVLSMARIVARLKPFEQALSLTLAPAALLSLGLAARQIDQLGVVLWPCLSACLIAWVYTLAAGRDFSFLGMFCFSLAGNAGVMLVCPVLSAGISTGGWTAYLISCVYISFITYDLSMLLRRRRPNETWAATIDLYRDVLNVFTYSVRVHRHWKRYPVWEVPKWLK